MKLSTRKGKEDIAAEAFMYGKWEEKLTRESEFIPGKTYIPPSGKVIGAAEMANGVTAVLDGWLTEGHWTDKFEAKLAQTINIRFASLVNSGSSANLLALAALTSPQLDRPLIPGKHEVIVAAAGFPTTLNPTLQLGLKPVFVDVELGTYVPSIEMIEAAMNGNTGAVMIAHTLGNPLPLGELVSLCKDRGIYLIEDNCDALGSLYEDKLTGSFGTLATQSFYPAHHITMGEGGAVLTDSPKLRKLVESFRDWGRDCWCEPGKENTCGKRFDHDFEHLPHGFDHKYVYSHVGYNMKSTDIQAAIGVAQLDRLGQFTAQRRRNFHYLYDGMKEKLEEYFILPVATPLSSPSWFGFLLTIRGGAPFTREEILNYLDSKKIGTRNLFGGNLLEQPAYAHIRNDYPEALPNSDVIKEKTFWVGVWPGLDKSRLDWILEALHSFCLSQ